MREPDSISTSRKDRDLHTVLIVSIFTFLIHLTESLAYSMRYAGLKTKQIAIAMSFVTSTLLVSRLSNMFQAPLLGKMVDNTGTTVNSAAIHQLMIDFRFIILAGAVGTTAGILLSPSFVNVFKLAIGKFLDVGSLPKMAILALKPSNTLKIIKCFRLPRLSMLNGVSISNIPKTFLVMNMFVTSIYTIGVLCSLYAGANLPLLKATAVQLSGIVNGIATILLTIIVDPEGARVTDQAMHGKRPISDVKTVVVFLLFSRLLGTLVVAQILFLPGSKYIMSVTEIIAKYF